MYGSRTSYKQYSSRNPGIVEIFVPLSADDRIPGIFLQWGRKTIRTSFGTLERTLKMRFGENFHHCKQKSVKCERTCCTELFSFPLFFQELPLLELSKRD
jgi:hypothetical protein